MGTRRTVLADGSMSGPPAASEWAVDPVAVATINPSRFTDRMKPRDKVRCCLSIRRSLSSKSRICVSDTEASNSRADPQPQFCPSFGQKYGRPGKGVRKAVF